jgi:hypothetical protein
VDPGVGVRPRNGEFDRHVVVDGVHYVGPEAP